MLALLLASLDSETEQVKFTRIYQMHHKTMEAKAFSILKNQQDAEDAMQNAFLQVIRHFEKAGTIADSELIFWLISIVKNEALLILRKRTRVVPPEDWSFFTSDVTDYYSLLDLISRLPDTCRAALEMKLICGYTNKEIASYLQISETAVSTRITRAKTFLKKLLESEGIYP